MLAILFGPSHEQFFFIEELENGIHPTRLHLLVDLIEKQVRRSDLQIVATTHSPQLLRLVNTANFKNSSIIYRLEEEPDGHIKQIADLPSNLQNVLNKQDTARLFESGWFENMVNFLSEDQPVKGE
jgi:predicted ATPase